MLERRTSKRYVLRATVAFRWTDSTGTEHAGRGFTLNISPVGVFVACQAALPPLHSPVMLEITIPPLGEGRPPLRLDSGGIVLRVDRRPEHLGFAASTDFRLSGEDYTSTLQ